MPTCTTCATSTRSASEILPWTNPRSTSWGLWVFIDFDHLDGCGAMLVVVDRSTAPVCDAGRQRRLLSAVAFGSMPISA